MPKPISDFLEILKILSKHNVDFIVVGGVCAVIHGAPVATFDLDMVHSRSQDSAITFKGGTDVLPFTKSWDV
jgi:hypothetical protein